MTESGVEVGQRTCTQRCVASLIWGARKRRAGDPVSRHGRVVPLLPESVAAPRGEANPVQGSESANALVWRQTFQFLAESALGTATSPRARWKAVH